jgi:hypothetical protein
MLASFSFHERRQDDMWGMAPAGTLIPINTITNASDRSAMCRLRRRAKQADTIED